MAEENNVQAQKKKISEERKRLKEEEKKQKKEIKRRAKEISKKESEIDDGETAGSKISSAFVTLIIILVWLAILAFLIKMDVGGFGSEILKPILKDVPVVNLILPGEPAVENPNDEYGGYTSLKDAVEEIKRLELELEHANTVISTNSDDLNTLQSEVLRLQEFEQMQLEFQRIKEQFYEEIIYSNAGPGPEGYQKYYEALDPTTAAALYKQVVADVEESEEVKAYAAAYASMKPKEAAGIFEKMTDDLGLVAKILGVMDTDTRGSILGVMDPTVAAKVTKIMNPEG